MAVSTQRSCESPVRSLAGDSPVPPPRSLGADAAAAPSSQQGTAHLEGLGDTLTRLGLRTRLMTPPGRIPSLHVVHPLAPVLAEDIYAGRGQDGVWWFWWSWAERIGQSEDLDSAAARIARVLAPNE